MVFMDKATRRGKSGALPIEAGHEIVDIERP
jgi:hypothetical protein